MLSVVFGSQKINFHQQGNEFAPKALRPTPGSGDICFITREAVPQIISHVDSCGVQIIEGPVNRTGALGPITSIYIQDSDQNLIEIATDQN